LGSLDPAIQIDRSIDQLEDVLIFLATKSLIVRLWRKKLRLQGRSATYHDRDRFKASTRGIDDRSSRHCRSSRHRRGEEEEIGTTFEALNLQAYRSKASAAPELEKRPAPLVGVCD
jgi:hypothetical protein